LKIVIFVGLVTTSDKGGDKRYDNQEMSTDEENEGGMLT
jgi:hypothetical protein